MLNLSFECSRGRRGLPEPNKCVQGARGVQILTFCDNVIIEWPLNIIFLRVSYFRKKKFQQGNQLGQKKRVNKEVWKEYF